MFVGSCFFAFISNQRTTTNHEGEGAVQSGCEQSCGNGGHFRSGKSHPQQVFTYIVALTHKHTAVQSQSDCCVQFL